jgi:hypothetical protein
MRKAPVLNWPGPFSPPEESNMISAIKELAAYYRQHYHVPITLASDACDVIDWNDAGIMIAMPAVTNDANDKAIGALAFGHNPEFGKQLSGDLVVIHDLPMVRVAKRSIAFLFLPTNNAATEFARKILEQHLPRMCRTYRHEMRDQLVTSITDCVQDRKKELQSSIREDSYELERLSLQLMQLSRKLESDRQVLRLFEHSAQWIDARCTRTFVDLTKLVPVVYESFRIEDESVIGVTYQIDIDHDGYQYHFDPYEVEVNLRQGKVYITGGTNFNGYIHPHVTDEKGNVCWGNIGHLVSRLAGEMDLFGLFQLVQTFLTTYNENDPYQKIEKWDPDYVEPDEDDEPYCSWCDDYGHEIEDCESCWWCPHCEQYDDHALEDCPNRPKEETEEESHELVEQETA